METATAMATAMVMGMETATPMAMGTEMETEMVTRTAIPSHDSSQTSTLFRQTESHVAVS